MHLKQKLCFEEHEAVYNIVDFPVYSSWWEVSHFEQSNSDNVKGADWIVLFFDLLSFKSLSVLANFWEEFFINYIIFVETKKIKILNKFNKYNNF